MPRRRRPARPGALADLAPTKILSQIVVLQIVYYGIAAALILFSTLVAGSPVTIDLLLSWKTVRADITTGWLLALCWMMDSLLCAIFLLLLIARSKLVPDFALTIHAINLIITSLYTKSIPSQLFWWVLQIASAALMISLGVWACQWRELKPIAFGGKTKDPINGSREGDEESGLTREDGGSSRDGAGTYEMANMASRHGAS